MMRSDDTHWTVRPMSCKSINTASHVLCDLHCLGHGANAVVARPYVPTYSTSLPHLRARINCTRCRRFGIQSKNCAHEDPRPIWHRGRGRGRRRGGSSSVACRPASVLCIGTHPGAARSRHAVGRSRCVGLTRWTLTRVCIEVHPSHGSAAGIERLVKSKSKRAVLMIAGAFITTSIIHSAILIERNVYGTL